MVGPKGYQLWFAKTGDASIFGRRLLVREDRTVEFGRMASQREGSLVLLVPGPSIPGDDPRQNLVRLELISNQQHSTYSHPGKRGGGLAPTFQARNCNGGPCGASCRDPRRSSQGSLSKISCNE